LLGVADRNAPLAAVAEQIAKPRQIVRRGNQQDVAHAAEHQRAERVVNHRLVVDGQQLLGRYGRQWVEPRAGTTRENDSLRRHRCAC
jgi:gamma-glutamyl phosphate reductase